MHNKLLDLYRKGYYDTVSVITKQAQDSKAQRIPTKEEVAAQLREAYGAEIADNFIIPIVFNKQAATKSPLKKEALDLGDAATLYGYYKLGQIFLNSSIKATILRSASFLWKISPPGIAVKLFRPIVQTIARGGLSAARAIASALSTATSTVAGSATLQVFAVGLIKVAAAFGLGYGVGYLINLGFDKAGLNKWLDSKIWDSLGDDEVPARLSSNYAPEIIRLFKNSGEPIPTAEEMKQLTEEYMNIFKSLVSRAEKLFPKAKGAEKGRLIREKTLAILAQQHGLSTKSPPAPNNSQKQPTQQAPTPLKPSPEKTQVAPPKPMATTHSVQKGESLSSISKKYYGNPNYWPLIFNANKNLIKNPSLIQPGWSLKIPPRQSKTQQQASQYLLDLYRKGHYNTASTIVRQAQEADLDNELDEEVEDELRMEEVKQKMSNPDFMREIIEKAKQKRQSDPHAGSSYVNPVLEISLETLPLEEETRSFLDQNNISTVNDLYHYQPSDLSIKGASQEIIEDLQDSMASINQIWDEVESDPEIDEMLNQIYEDMRPHK